MGPIQMRNSAAKHKVTISLLDEEARR